MKAGKALRKFYAGQAAQKCSPASSVSQSMFQAGQAAQKARDRDFQRHVMFQAGQAAQKWRGSRISSPAVFQAGQAAEKCKTRSGGFSFFRRSASSTMPLYQWGD